MKRKIVYIRINFIYGNFDTLGASVKNMRTVPIVCVVVAVPSSQLPPRLQVHLPYKEKEKMFIRCIKRKNKEKLVLKFRCRFGAFL